MYITNRRPYQYSYIIFKTLQTINTKWPRDPTTGFYCQIAHETDGQTGIECPHLGTWGHWSTIDSAFIAAGALFAGNYFGGEIAVLADEIADRPYYGGVIQNQETNDIYMVVEPDGTFGYGFIK